MIQMVTGWFHSRAMEDSTTSQASSGPSVPESRRTSPSTIEEGYTSSCLHGFANASYRLGEHCSDYKLRKVIGNDEWLTESHGRYVDHLKGMEFRSRQIGLDPRSRHSQLIKVQSEFVGNRAGPANALLRRAGPGSLHHPKIYKLMYC